MVAFVGEKKESIFKAVSEMYTDVARHPNRPFHFQTGRPACLFVGYPNAQLDAIPETAVESFAGVAITQKSVIFSTQNRDCPYDMRFALSLLSSYLLTSE